MLREEYGLAPAGVLGHSAGEIAAGYADGCLTAEQTVLIAYHRGRMAPDHGVAGGLMAAVGLAAGDADARLAKEGLAGAVVVGCDNSPANVTLSGPAAQLTPLLEALKAEGVFVRELDTLGIAYHSPALDAFSGALRAELEAVLPAPKPRSATWLSTCYPLDTEDPAAAACGPEYHVQSYVSRVRFVEACAAIPADALLLEVGPHALLRSPLRQNRASLPYVSLMKKGSEAGATLRNGAADLWRKGVALAWRVPAAAGDDGAAAAAELPRDVRDALVSWNHATDYDLPSYSTYSGGKGTGLFEKTYDLGARRSAPAILGPLCHVGRKCVWNVPPGISVVQAAGVWPEHGAQAVPATRQPPPGVPP